MPTDYAPSEHDRLWTPEAHDFIYPQAIIRATAEFNATSHEDLLMPLRASVEHDQDSGVELAVLSEAGDSTEEAVALFNPFANDLSDNMLLRAEYCRRVFRESGITDKEGRHLPVIAFAAPANTSTINLSKEERRLISDGDLGPAAAEYLKLVRHRGFGKVALAGFSQGGSMVAAAGRESYAAGLDVTAVAAGDPANVEQRSRLKLLNDFNSQAKHLGTDIRASGIDAFAEAHKGDSLVNYAKAILRQTKLNLALYGGLATDRFAEDMAATISRHEDVVVTLGFGNNSPITPKPAIQSAAQMIRGAQPEGSNPVELVEVDQARHTWGDRVNLLAHFYAYSLQRLR